MNAAREGVLDGDHGRLALPCIDRIEHILEGLAGKGLHASEMTEEGLLGIGPRFALERDFHFPSTGCLSAHSTIFLKPACTSSSEAAMVMRTKPSPCSPKAEPGTSPTLASSRIRSQMSTEDRFSGRKSRKK